MAISVIGAEHVNSFLSSRDRGSPFPLTRELSLVIFYPANSDWNVPFPVGVGQVIKGWDQGLEGMCLNEKRILTIPSDLAYGTSPIPTTFPNVNLRKVARQVRGASATSSLRAPRWCSTSSLLGLTARPRERSCRCR